MSASLRPVTPPTTARVGEVHLTGLMRPMTGCCGRRVNRLRSDERVVFRADYVTCGKTGRALRRARRNRRLDTWANDATLWCQEHPRMVVAVVALLALAVGAFSAQWAWVRG